MVFRPPRNQMFLYCLMTIIMMFESNSQNGHDRKSQNFSNIAIMPRNSPPDFADRRMRRSSYFPIANLHVLPRRKREPSWAHNQRNYPGPTLSKRIEPLRNAACNTTIMELAYAAFYTVSTEKENTTDIINAKITTASSELCDKYLDLEECMLKGGEFERIREQVFDVLRDQGYQDACGSSLAFQNFVLVIMCPVVWLFQHSITFHFG
ncbi:hypothetical protein DdX_09359 [Ditylenchus destructor]|uniref:Pectinesterase inhibitor domain-containing protein n=1 Tax=Ditylenchus destructor TaxID=166010 RepID=A0AAD4N1S8_9BILA|nr:hypothetical protein DdX_09359 [Ditylenchus destructor]